MVSLVWEEQTSGTITYSFSFFNAILNNTITSVSLTDPNVEPAHTDDKASVMDLRVVTNLGHQINVEMQVQGHRALPERMLLYWAKMYGSQGRIGKSYVELNKAVQIVIADFELLSKPLFHSMFQIVDSEDGSIFSSDLEIHVLELPKLKDIEPGNANELEKWLLFMKSDKKAKEALALESSVLKEALTEIERLSQDPRTVEVAIAREIHLKDQLQREEDAEFRGREEGREEGVELRNREIVHNPHAENMSVETIARLTKISLEKVKEIIQSTTQ